MAGVEGGEAALHCALQGIHPERLVFASDYPQDFTGVNTDTGKGMALCAPTLKCGAPIAAQPKPKRGYVGRHGGRAAEGNDGSGLRA